MSNSRIPLVAIVGRTNVGKSTLFNLFTGRRLAIVEDFPGVTRDRCYAVVKREKATFRLIDTGGLFGEEENSFTQSVREQAQIAIAEADLVLAIFDGLSGPHPDDPQVVDLLRRADKPVFWVINKCEKPSTEEAAVEFYGLGISENIFPISAAHNQGVPELFAAMKSVLAEHAAGEVDEDPGIKIAIVGKPNVGKSTFVNRVLGEERLITSPISGTTRDAVDIELIRDGQKYTIVDTAGLRKKAQIEDASLERFSNLRTLRALAQADVAIILIDAQQGKPTEQDAKIAGLAHDRGIPFIFAVNKWDLVEKDHRTAKEFTKELRRELKFCPYAPVHFISALSGKRCPSILPKAKEIFEHSQFRFQTAELNRVLEVAMQRKQAPVYRGQPIKLFFATQIGVTPPTFVLFMNHPTKLNFSYKRYLKNAIRRAYEYEGSDIKLHFRKRTEKSQREQAAVNE